MDEISVTRRVHTVCINMSMPYQLVSIAGMETNVIGLTRQIDTVSKLFVVGCTYELENYAIKGIKPIGIAQSYFISLLRCYMPCCCHVGKLLTTSDGQSNCDNLPVFPNIICRLRLLKFTRVNSEFDSLTSPPSAVRQLPNF